MFNKPSLSRKSGCIGVDGFSLRRDVRRFHLRNLSQMAVVKVRILRRPSFRQPGDPLDIQNGSLNRIQPAISNPHICDNTSDLLRGAQLPQPTASLSSFVRHIPRRPWRPDFAGEGKRANIAEAAAHFPSQVLPMP